MPKWVLLQETNVLKSICVGFFRFSILLVHAQHQQWHFESHYRNMNTTILWPVENHKLKLRLNTWILTYSLLVHCLLQQSFISHILTSSSDNDPSTYCQWNLVSLLTSQFPVDDHTSSLRHCCTYFWRRFVSYVEDVFEIDEIIKRRNKGVFTANKYKVECGRPDDSQGNNITWKIYLYIYICLYLGFQEILYYRINIYLFYIDSCRSSGSCGH